jgi:PadR family transcriptional regulator, regulatory protein AphA
VAEHNQIEPADLPIPAYVILGMLRLGARSGYDIKRIVDRSTRYLSAISHAQIYPLLKQLERAGLVRGRAEPRGKRRRRAYEITKDGEAVLRRWLRDEEDLVLDVRDVGLLKLFFADALDEPEVVELVRALRRRSERILGELRRESLPAAAVAAARGHRFPHLTLPFGTAMHEAWVEYCDTLEAELRTRPARTRA